TRIFPPDTTSVAGSTAAARYRDRTPAHLPTAPAHARCGPPPDPDPTSVRRPAMVRPTSAAARHDHGRSVVPGRRRTVRGWSPESNSLRHQAIPPGHRAAPSAMVRAVDRATADMGRPA